MNTERIKAIQEETAYPDSQTVKDALMRVWNECEQDKPKWISVEDRLPEPYSEIIAFREDAGVFSGYYGSLEDLFTDDQRSVIEFSPELEYEAHFYSHGADGVFLLDSDMIPTHWMPLPEPPTK